MTEVKLPAHSEIPEKYTWNAPSMFKSIGEWEAEFQAVSESVKSAAQYQGRMVTSATVTADALAARDQVWQRALILSVYSGMNAAVDRTDQAALAMDGRARGLISQAFAAFSFVEPELLSIGLDTLAAWRPQEPRLAIYVHYFDDLFRKQAHVRSAEVEEVLGLLGDPFSGASTTNDMLTDADLQFAPAKGADGAAYVVSQSTRPGLMTNPDREVRRTTWENFTDAHLAHRNALTSCLVTSLKQNVFKMRTRRHSSTLAMTLFEDNIPVEVFHNLIGVFKQNLPTWHRYWAIRRKALGVDTLRYYDIWAPLTQHPPKVSYEQAVDWICDGLAPMGKDYVQIVRRGCLEDRWVDVYPNQGKGGGAFSSGVQGTHPFIMMGFSETLSSLSTLAHELGHSVHSYLTWQTQPFVNSNYSLFVAEVASNFHQAMVRAHLFATHTDPNFQLALIDEAMANFVRYFFQMPTLARFELDLHERMERGEGLSADQLINSMADLFAEGFGGQMDIDHDRLGITWAEFGHLYADYYVYQYATGISGANALARRILSGVPHAAEDYIRFLKAGGSVYPLDALKIAGVDLTKPEPVEAAFEVLAGLVDRLETLMG